MMILMAVMMILIIVIRMNIDDDDDDYEDDYEGDPVRVWEPDDAAAGLSPVPHCPVRWVHIKQAWSEVSTWRISTMFLVCKIDDVICVWSLITLT